MRALPVKRGCGSRKEGGCYLETGLSPHGSPIEAFLLDPPLTAKDGIPPDWLEAHRNPILFERDGAWHVVIWIGAEYYPSPWDYIEETRVAGSSRRVSTSFDFSKLTPASRQYFVHGHADVWCEQAPGGEPVQSFDLRCPKQLHAAVPDQPIELAPHCLGLAKYLTEDLPEGYGETEWANSAGDGRTRTLPCGHSYQMYNRQPGLLLPIAPAVFMALPITGVAMVNKADGSFDETTEGRVVKAAVETYRVDA